MEADEDPNSEIEQNQAFDHFERSSMISSEAKEGNYNEVTYLRLLYHRNILGMGRGT